MSFTDAVKTGDEYVWGANWRTPSYDELNELLLAAQGNSKAKVTCVYGQNEDDVWGFTFTGKEAGYTSNSVFFPCYSCGSSDIGFEWYWSSTAVNASYKWQMYLAYSKNETHKSAWEDEAEYCTRFVRPVLVEE